MQMLAGKYVPPHMRNRQPVSASAFPAETRMNQKPKKAKTVKKVKKVQEPKVAPVDEVKVKPHCELFLADLPAPMRSVTTLAGLPIATFEKPIRIRDRTPEGATN